MYLWVIARFRGPKSELNGSYTNSESTLKKYASEWDFGGLPALIQYSLSTSKKNKIVRLSFE